MGPTDKNATTSILRVLSSICFACQGWGQAWRNVAWIIAHEGFGKDHNVLLGLQQLSDERPKSNHNSNTYDNENFENQLINEYMINCFVLKSGDWQKCK